jgi:hypothetical protein
MTALSNIKINVMQRLSDDQLTTKKILRTAQLVAKCMRRARVGVKK